MKFKRFFMSGLGVLIIVGALLLMLNPHIRGAVKLVVAEDPFVEVQESSSSKKVMAHWDEGEGIQTLLEELENDGWMMEDHFGSAFMFTNNDRTLVVNIWKWTNYFVVAEMTEG
ncbi:hypothetical protein ACWE42_05980 [Sutcliffiella cohnii]